MRMVQANAEKSHQETGQKEAEAESAAININQSLVSRLMERNADVANRATAQYIVTQQTREDLRMTVLAIEAIESANKQAAPNTPERATSNAADKTKESYGQQTMNAISRL